MSRSRSFVVTSLMVALCLVAAGCQVARTGSRCTGSGWGQQGDLVLRCERGRWVRKATRAQVVALVQAVLAARVQPLQFESPGSLGQPNILNAADPDVLVDGGNYYVFATKNFRRVPVRVMSDPTAVIGEAFAQTVEAMPGRVPWATTRDEVWAPTVRKVGDRFVMFFASFLSNPPDPSNDLCIGRAFAPAPAGPYVADQSPFLCGVNGRNGALDPSLFVAPDGSLTLLGAFGGSPDNIWAVPLDGAANQSGEPRRLLTRNQPWEDWFLENPSMIFDGTGYVLAYSAGRWQQGDYVTGLARCSTPLGPCTASPVGPWLRGSGDRVGPGGLSFFSSPQGQSFVIYQTYPAGQICGTCRSSHVRTVSLTSPIRLG